MFPFENLLAVDKNLNATSQEVLENIFPLLTLERQKKIQAVAEKRIFRHSIVMENIYDRGNISAVLRSAEAFGFGDIHLIETFDKFKESQRTTAGADKWLEIKKWPSTSKLVSHIKSQGKKIAVTYLDAQSKPLAELNFKDENIALVLGNEKDGVSQEIVAAADYKVIIPMTGFVQSFNISVAGALCFYQMWMATTQNGKSFEMNQNQIETLKAVYALRTLDSAPEILKSKLRK